MIGGGGLYGGYVPVPLLERFHSCPHFYKTKSANILIWSKVEPYN